jgi:hypothetical protein
MALQPLPAFTPDTGGNVSVGAASAAFLLPGTPASDTTVLVTNTGALPVQAKLGSSNAVTVTGSTGVTIMPGQTLALGIGANTYIAMIATGGLTGVYTTVNLTTGN